MHCLNRKILIFITFSLSIVFAWLVLIQPVHSSAKSIDKFDSIDFKKIGQSVKENKENLKEINSLILDLDKKAPNEIASVNGVSISLEELGLRYQLFEAFTKETVNNNKIFNILIEEKLLISEAAKRGLLPTKSEIDRYIVKEKFQDQGARFSHKDFIIATGLTEQEYWEYHVPYNIARCLIFQNLYDDVIKGGIESGDLKQLDRLYLDDINQQTEYYNQFKQELKENANIITDENFVDLLIQ